MRGWIDWSITSELTALLEFNAKKLFAMHTAATIPLHVDFVLNPTEWFIKTDYNSLIYSNPVLSITIKKIVSLNKTEFISEYAMII